GAGGPVDGAVRACGPPEAGVFPRLDGGEAREAMVGVHGQELVGIEGRRRPVVGAFRDAGHVTAEAELAQLRNRPHAGPPFAERTLELGHADRVWGHDAEPHDDHPPPHAGTPMPDSVPEQTTVPSSSVISTSDRRRRRRNTSFCPRISTRWPGRTMPVNSTVA